MNHLAVLLLKDICFLRYKLLYVMIIPTVLTLLVAFYNPVMLGVPCITIIILCVIPMSLQSLLIFVVSGITEHFPHIWDSFAAGFSISIVMIVACVFFLIICLSAKISEKLLRVRE